MPPITAEAPVATRPAEPAIVTAEGRGGTTTTRARTAACRLVASSRTTYAARRRGVTTVIGTDPVASSRARRTSVVRPATWRNSSTRSPGADPSAAGVTVVVLPPTSAVTVSAGTILSSQGRLFTPGPACQRKRAERITGGVDAVATPVSSVVVCTTARQCRGPRTWSTTGWPGRAAPPASVTRPVSTAVWPRPTRWAAALMEVAAAALPLGKVGGVVDVGEFVGPPDGPCDGCRPWWPPVAGTPGTPGTSGRRRRRRPGRGAVGRAGGRGCARSLRLGVGGAVG